MYKSPRLWWRGLTEDLAPKLEQMQLGDNSSNQVRRLFRTMRADMVFAQIESTDPKLDLTLQQVFDKYHADYTTPFEGHVSLPIKQLQQSLPESPTVVDFYRQFYGLGLKTNSRATWLPYEIEVMKYFYQRQADMGDYLTLLDKRVLQARLEIGFDNTQSDLLVSSTRNVFGIPLDRTVIPVHWRALVLGRI